MATITLRATKGSPLTNTEVDTNFTNINTEVGTKLNTSSYTAADVLSKLLTVDGAGSGIDADTLDGLNSATANTVSTIVARDASGNFAAGTITATLTGNTTGTHTGAVVGNASTATALATARTIGGVSFDGTAAINLPGVNTSGNQNTSGTAAGLSTTLVVASGGTGQTSLTANNVILGNGTSGVSFVAPSTSGNVLTSNGTTWQSTAPAASGISTGKAIAMAMIFGF
jgi:hypothetical protein